MAGGVTTRFVYDGDQAVVEADGANRPTLYRLPGVGFVRGGAQRYEQGNALGSVLAVRDASGHPLECANSFALWVRRFIGAPFETGVDETASRPLRSMERLRERTRGKGQKRT